MTHPNGTTRVGQPPLNHPLAPTGAPVSPSYLPHRSGMVQRHYYEIIRAGAPCHLYFGAQLCCRSSVLGPTFAAAAAAAAITYYQVIRALPVSIYCCVGLLQNSADLEFSREDNPGVDGAAAVDALLSLLRDALRERFGLDMQVGLHACPAEPAAQCVAGTLWRGLGSLPRLSAPCTRVCVCVCVVVCTV